MSEIIPRDKFFYAPPALFPDWPYPSRYAIGMNFSDFAWMNRETFRFLIKGKIYTISKAKALVLGNQYVLSGGILPNLIPKEEFQETDAGIRTNAGNSNDPKPTWPSSVPQQHWDF